MIKIKNLHLKYWDVNNLHGWAMVNEDFIKSYYEKYDEGCFLMLNILKNYLNFIMIYQFYQNE